MQERNDRRIRRDGVRACLNVAFSAAIVLVTLTGSAAAANSDNARREACNKWLETGVQPQGITRDDCNFAEARPEGSILRPGTSDATRIWREQADHQKRFVLDTGSEAKEEPK